MCMYMHIRIQKYTPTRAPRLHALCKYACVWARVANGRQLKVRKQGVKKRRRRLQGAHTSQKTVEIVMKIMVQPRAAAVVAVSHPNVKLGDDEVSADPQKRLDRDPGPVHALPYAYASDCHIESSIQTAYTPQHCATVSRCIVLLEAAMQPMQPSVHTP